jgi:hypothetical protein
LAVVLLYSSQKRTNSSIILIVVGLQLRKHLVSRVALIPAIQEVEIRRIKVQGQPQQKVQEHSLNESWV